MAVRQPKRKKVVPKTDVHPKITAVGLTGYLATVIVYAAGQFGYTVPPEVAVAAVSAVMVLAGYLKGS